MSEKFAYTLASSTLLSTSFAQDWLAKRSDTPTDDTPCDSPQTDSCSVSMPANGHKRKDITRSQSVLKHSIISESEWFLTLIEQLIRGLIRAVCYRVWSQAGDLFE